MKITYNIRKLELQSNGYYLTAGWLVIEDENKYNIWPIVSGKYGRGTAPIGLYKLIGPIKLTDIKENNSYKNEGFPWICGMQPLGKCVDDQGNRSGLALHGDGGVFGTLGCLGVAERDISLYYKLKELFKKEKEIILEVI